MMFMKALRRRLVKPEAFASAQSDRFKQKKVDLAIIGGRGYHSSYGGVENAIRQISNHMAASYSLTIVVYGTDSSEVESSSLSNVDLSFVYSPHKIYQVFGQHGASLACALHAVFISKPRTVLIFASGPSIFVPLFRLFRTPVITSLRAIDSARDKWGWVSRKILQMGEYFAWKYSTTFTTNSMEMISLFKVKRDDAVFIPNGGLAAKDNDSQIRHDYSLLDLHLLLEAHSKLPADHRLPLVIAGGHSKSDKYKQELMRYAGSDVIFLGHISPQELDPLMVHCRAFLLPSVLEGMSNSLLTAMATGCAVLASDIPPNTDVLQNPDAVFSADNIPMLSNGLLRLAREPEFADQMGRSLKRHATNTYSWQRTTDLFYAQIETHLEGVR